MIAKLDSRPLDRIALAGAAPTAHMPQPDAAPADIFAFDRMRRLWQCRASIPNPATRSRRRN
jgi:hypothetical protein